MRPLILCLALCLPVAAFAAGSDSSTPPKPTQTSKDCKTGEVFDADKKLCVAPEKSGLNDEILYDAVRELAYAGRYEDATRVLNAMSDPQDDRVLTYRGFIARKTGDMQAGMTWYRLALSRNPDNILARSYMGQALVEMGQVDEARLQLAEIWDRGGTGTWAEYALAQAISSGKTFDY